MAEQNNPRIFLCHASEDKPQVKKLYRQLKAAGYHPWLDQYDLIPGQDWRREIRKLITHPYNVIVVCLSQKSTTKRGVVQQEIKWALDILERMPEDIIYLIPARLEPCQAPERLSSLHWVDLFEPDGFDNLKRALDFEIGKRYPSFEPELKLVESFPRDNEEITIDDVKKIYLKFNKPIDFESTKYIANYYVRTNSFCQWNVCGWIQMEEDDTKLSWHVKEESLANLEKYGPQEVDHHTFEIHIGREPDEWRVQSKDGDKLSLTKIRVRIKKDIKD